MLAASTPWYTPSLDAVWQASESSSRHRWRKYSSGIGDPKGGVWPAAQEAVWLAPAGNEDLSDISCLRGNVAIQVCISLYQEKGASDMYVQEKRDLKMISGLHNLKKKRTSFDNCNIGGIDAFCITVLFTLSLKDLHPTNMFLCLWKNIESRG